MTQGTLTVLAAAIPAVVTAVFGGFGYLIKRLERLDGRLDEIIQTSLQIKKDLRQEERGELVTLRVAIEEWEDYLESTLLEHTMGSPQTARVEQ